MYPNSSSKSQIKKNCKHFDGSDAQTLVLVLEHRPQIFPKRIADFTPCQPKATDTKVASLSGLNLFGSSLPQLSLLIGVLFAFFDSRSTISILSVGINSSLSYNEYRRTLETMLSHLTFFYKTEQDRSFDSVV